MLQLKGNNWKTRVLFSNADCIGNLMGFYSSSGMVGKEKMRLKLLA